MRGFLVVALLCGLGGVMTAAPASAGSTVTLFESDGPGGDEVEVPATVCAVTITVAGGAGGAGGATDSPGGNGAVVSARVDVVPGSQLVAFTGSAGGAASAGSFGGSAGGGGGGYQFSEDAPGGGGGGGASAVSAAQLPLVVAGGGGGGGGGGFATLPQATPGGDAGPVGSPGEDGTGLADGGGGTGGGAGASTTGGAGAGGGVVAGGTALLNAGAGGSGDGAVGGGGGGGTDAEGPSSGMEGTSVPPGGIGNPGFGIFGGSGGPGQFPGGGGGGTSGDFAGAGGGGGIGFGGGGGGTGTSPDEGVEVGGGGGGGAGYGAGAGGGAGGGGGGSSFLVTGGQLLTNEATNTGDGELLITYDLATDTCVPTTIDVAKTLEGTATGGFTVNVECGTALVATLGFDASGMPTTTSDPVRWAPTGGWWRATLDVTETTECSATETDADGAASTRWTCAWDATFENGQAEDLGCDAADGTGVGPVAFTLGGGGASLLEQEATITFTNSLPESPAESPAESLPEALLLVPRFTG